jgi:hypothetical protein
VHDRGDSGRARFQLRDGPSANQIKNRGGLVT